MTKLLVHAAAGAQGQAIVWQALEAGYDVRALLRDNTKDPFGGDVEVVRGDMDDADAVCRASEGMDAVALTLPITGTSAEAERRGKLAVDAAVKAGVSRFGYNQSGRMSPTAAGVPVMDARIEVGRYLRASGMPSVTLQPTIFMGNATGPAAASTIVNNGIYAFPLPGDMPVGWISWEDFAAYLIAAMAEPNLMGTVLNAGGPEDLFGADVAAALSYGVGRPVIYAELQLPYFAAGLNAALGAGVGDDTAKVYRWYHQDFNVLRSHLSPELAAMKLKPKTLAEWAKAQDWPALARHMAAA